jgi:hypothetical protein
MGQAVSCDARFFLIAHRSVMDDCVEATDRVDLSRDILRAGDRLEVSGHNGMSFLQSATRVGCAGRLACMEDNLVTFAR